MTARSSTALPDSGAIGRVVHRGKVVERREQFRIGSARPTFELADQGREVGLTIAPRLSNTGGASPVTASAAIRLGAMVGRERARHHSTLAGNNSCGEIAVERSAVET